MTTKAGQWRADALAEKETLCFLRMSRPLVASQEPGRSCTRKGASGMRRMHKVHAKSFYSTGTTILVGPVGQCLGLFDRTSRLSSVVTEW